MLYTFYMKTIRPVKQEDLPILAELFVKTYDHFDVGEKWNVQSALDLLQYWFNRQNDLAFLSESEGVISGAFFASVKPWWDGMHLVDGEIFVDPDLQKKGIGSKLSVVMFEQAIEKYAAKVWDTYTFRNSEHPLSWYKKMGFKEIDEWVMISGDIDEALKVLKNS